MRVCVVVPMFNEESIAKVSIETILQYIRQLPPIFTLLIVNDGSRDKTGEIVESLVKQIGNPKQLRLISHSINKGYGAAIITGSKFACENSYDYVLFMDSDLTNHPKYLKIFYDKMILGFDYIKATRYAKGGSTDCVPLLHKIISKTGNLIAKFFYRIPLTDLTNGFRAVRVNVLRRIHHSEFDFSIILEELYYTKYLTQSFCEIPYVLGSRLNGQGKSKFSFCPKTFIKYLKYPLKSCLRSLAGIK